MRLAALTSKRSPAVSLGEKTALTSCKKLDSFVKIRVAQGGPRFFRDLVQQKRLSGGKQRCL